MGLLKKLGKIVNVILEDDSIEKHPKNDSIEKNPEDIAVEKGNDFERYVVDLFDGKYYSVVEWTTDMGRKHDRYVESDSRPDLTMRYVPKNESFCIECKFRSDLYQGKLQWSNPQQLKRYQAFSRETGLPFFVVIGLGGSAERPETMFCIPLEEAKYPGLYPSVFEKFERDPKKNFFWKNGILK